MPADFVAQVAARYIAAYEKLTGRAFVPGEMPANARIVRNVASQLSR
jgi:phosphoribosylaminoimidazole-succinocarboxamide synthase